MLSIRSMKHGANCVIRFSFQYHFDGGKSDRKGEREHICSVRFNFTDKLVEVDNNPLYLLVHVSEYNSNFSISILIKDPRLL